MNTLFIADSIQIYYNIEVRKFLLGLLEDTGSYCWKLYTAELKQSILADPVVKTTFPKKKKITVQTLKPCLSPIWMHCVKHSTAWLRYLLEVVNSA